MKRLYNLLVLLLLACVTACYAQTTNRNLSANSTTWATFDAGGQLQVPARGSQRTVQVQDAVGHMVRADGINAWWLLPETRKDDGHGPNILQVRHTARLLRTDQLAPANYIALAKAVGYQYPAEEAQVMQAVHDADLPVYDYKEVDEYLYRQALRHGAKYRWVWKPLRDSDIKAMHEAGSDYAMTSAGLMYPTKYAQEVPVRVLAEMKRVMDCLPGAVFLVSDYEAVRPDPFLAVTTLNLLANSKIWIVSSWDEPGFVDHPSTEGTVARR